jgi:hypothetical protein
VSWEKGKVSHQEEGVTGVTEIVLGSPDRSFLEASRGARVSGHAQVIKDQTDVACEFSHFLCNAAYAFGFDDPDGKAAEAGDVFRAVAGAYATAVFIEIPVQDVVAAVFDGPVAAIDSKELLCVNLFRGSAGDAVGDVVGDLSGPLFNRFPLDQETLLHVGEVEVGIEFGGGPDFTGFDPTMIRGIISNEIRFLAILEIQFDIFKECGLVAFDGEVIMGFTLPA